MVGSRTVINDDPQLTTRLVHGRQPLRVVLDRAGVTPAGSKVYDRTTPTLLFTRALRADLKHVEQVTIADDDPLKVLLQELHQRGIRSMLVEGGAGLLNAFLAQGLWDEARVITGTASFGNGTPTPIGLPPPQRTLDLDGDMMHLHVNTNMHQNVDPTWYW